MKPNIDTLKEFTIYYYGTICPKPLYEISMRLCIDNWPAWRSAEQHRLVPVLGFPVGRLQARCTFWHHGLPGFYAVCGGCFVHLSTLWAYRQCWYPYSMQVVCHSTQACTFHVLRSAHYASVLPGRLFTPLGQLLPWQRGSKANGGNCKDLLYQI